MNPGAETIAVTLHRNDSNEPWGFRLNGGIDFTTPLSISQVCVSLEFSFIEGYFCMYMFLQSTRRPKKALWKMDVPRIFAFLTQLSKMLWSDCMFYVAVEMNSLPGVE